MGLAQARSLGLGYILANQYPLGQLPPAYAGGTWDSSFYVVFQLEP